MNNELQTIPIRSLYDSPENSRLVFDDRLTVRPGEEGRLGMVADTRWYRTTPRSSQDRPRFLARFESTLTPKRGMHARSRNFKEPIEEAESYQRLDTAIEDGKSAAEPGHEISKNEKYSTSINLGLSLYGITRRLHPIYRHFGYFRPPCGCFVVRANEFVWTAIRGVTVLLGNRLHSDNMVRASLAIPLRNLKKHLVLLDLEYALFTNRQDDGMFPICGLNVVLHFIGAQQILWTQLLLRVHIGDADRSKYAA